MLTVHNNIPLAFLHLKSVLARQKNVYDDQYLILLLRDEIAFYIHSKKPNILFFDTSRRYLYINIDSVKIFSQFTCVEKITSGQPCPETDTPKTDKSLTKSTE